MKKSVAALALALSGIVPALAQEPVPFPDPPAVDLPSGATTNLAVFRAEALRADAVSLEASRIALKRSRDPDVRSYAQRVIDNRTATTKALTTGDALFEEAVSAAGGGALDPADRARIDRLRSARADAFDRAYAAEQARSDSRMLALYQGFYRTGDTAPGRRFAYEALPYIETDRSRSAELNDLYGG